MIETPNWNKDKFGTVIEGTKNYFRHRTEDLTSFAPFEGEAIDGYCRRIMEKIKKWEEVNLEAHVYNGRKMWYTHMNPSGCWICDGINYLWILHETTQQIGNLFPNPPIFDGKTWQPNPSQ